jgi:aromatic-L-amino-acid decarboxylase
MQESFKNAQRPSRYARDMDFQRVARHVTNHLQRSRDAPVAVRVDPRVIRTHLRTRYTFDEPTALDELFDDVTEMLWKWTEHGNNPRHLGLFRPGVDATCVIAEMLVAAYDPNLATWNFAPAANEIERHTLDFLMRRFGLDPERGLAHFTSGGQESNHTAVITALTHAFPQAARQGLRALRGNPVFYLSTEGHHSFDKVAHATGLGRDALRFVPVDARLRMDPEALERQIVADRARGDLPFLIVGTAGTTSAGVIDPLPALAEIARRQGLWYHVDAAWGGAAIVSDRLRPLLAGIEQADSITCDAHKWLSVPVAAGMFFCRARRLVEAAFGTETAYVPEQAADGRVYHFVTSLQWSRRFNGLKLFMLLAERGHSGVAARIERQTAMGEALRERLIEAGFLIVNETPLPVVCFTHASLAGDPAAHDRVCAWLAERQVAWISRTLLDRRTPALRACITHVDTAPRDLDALIDGLRDALNGCLGTPV